MKIDIKSGVLSRMLFLTLILSTSLLLISCGKEKEENIQKNPEEKVNEISELKIENTKEFDEDRLYFITDVEYTGPDFDGDDKEIKEHSCITVRNDSKEYLRSAKIQVEMNGNEKAEAYIESLPSGMETVAILHGTEGYEPKKSYKVIKCDSKYESDVLYDIDGLQISIEFPKVIIYNGSDKDLSGYTIKYKGKIDKTLIGGYNSKVTFDSLKPGESFEFVNEYATSGARDIEIVEIIE